MILNKSFYQRDTVSVSRDLLGKVLVHESVEGTTSGRIVETEAYLGPEDRAAHSFGGRRTVRNEVLFGKKGCAYVYFIYGMYFCFNVTTGDVSGKPDAVLIRALEPVDGVDIMVKRRGLFRGKSVNLTNGPGKLCIAMGISKLQNKMDLTVPPFYIKEGSTFQEEDILERTRVGIDYAGEWKDRFLRFYFNGNRFVSVK
jgi:DNA-3-methyladenine glycosylase